MESRVGLRKAAAMIYRGESMGAGEARRLGLVNWRVEPEDVEARPEPEGVRALLEKHRPSWGHR